MNDQTTPVSAPTPVTTPDPAPTAGNNPGDSVAPGVTGPGTVTPSQAPPSPPPTKEQVFEDEYCQMLSGAYLFDLVEKCPPKLLPKLYQAGNTIREMVNQRWAENR